VDAADSCVAEFVECCEIGTEEDEVVMLSLPVVGVVGGDEL
jgi:hypothetical protein